MGPEQLSHHSGRIPDHTPEYPPGFRFEWYDAIPAKDQLAYVELCPGPLKNAITAQQKGENNRAFRTTTFKIHPGIHYTQFLSGKSTWEDTNWFLSHPEKLPDLSITKFVFGSVNHHKIRLYPHTIVLAATLKALSEKGSDIGTIQTNASQILRETIAHEVQHSLKKPWHSHIERNALVLSYVLIYGLLPPGGTFPPGLTYGILGTLGSGFLISAARSMYWYGRSGWKGFLGQWETDAQKAAAKYAQLYRGTFNLSLDQEKTILLARNLKKQMAAAIARK